MNHARIITEENQSTVRVEIPTPVFAELQALSERKQVDTMEMIIYLIHLAYQSDMPTSRHHKITQTLLETGVINHLRHPFTETKPGIKERESPPLLPGPPVSELLIAQRRGEL